MFLIIFGHEKALTYLVCRERPYDRVIATVNKTRVRAQEEKRLKKEELIFKIEEQKRKDEEEQALKEWENKFDQEQKLKEEEEILKFEKLKRREEQKLGLKDQEDQIFKEELPSRLDTFDIEKTKKN